MGDSCILRELSASERPREKFLSLGAKALTTEEILAILLRTGRKGQSVLALARQVISELHDGAYGLNSITPRELQKIKGIGADKAVTVCAAIELGRRLRALSVKRTYRDFSSPQAVASYMMERLRYEPQEHFMAAFLTIKNRLITVASISSGGINSSQAEQRLVFRKAVEANAASIILIHNHPSGDSYPSPEDIKVTKVFMAAGKVMGIPVLDHVVIGDGVYTSLHEENLL